MDRPQPRNEGYDQQLTEKVEYLRQLFADLDAPEPEVFDSPPTGFRMRAEFKIWHEGQRASYAMYRPGEYKKPYCIENFPPGSLLINRLMPPLLDAINASDNLRRKLFQIEFLTSLSGEAVITLIYHKNLTDEWEKAARELQQSLRAQVPVYLIGRSRKQKRVLERDYLIEKLHVCGREYQYQQIETGFTQPNALVCQKMLNWAVNSTRNNGGDLLELYCGNGNFTLPLSQNFNRVLATELAKNSVQSAHYNMQLNKVDNIDIVRMSSEEFADAWDEVRPFRRLSHIDLHSYQFSTLLMDPPRAGVDKHSLAIAQRFENIVYISCNPKTLRRDLETLTPSHYIERLALFDQFPFTTHIECGVILRKRKA